MTQKIVFTGGGTAGHVTPNMALIDALQAEHWTIDYIGSAAGVEKNMIEAIHIPFHVIRCGKLRRYWSWKNLYDPINMLIGIAQSYGLLRRLKPNVVFSKGGFVAFPVVVGAWLNRIPVIAHESDMSPGLANRMSFPFVDKICINFAAASRHFKNKDKIELTGTPIRRELFKGDARKGLALCGFTADKPCLLVMGGSQGSSVINRCVRQALDALCESFQVIHLCGRNHLDASLSARAGYVQFEYANAELPDLFAASDLILSRAGANALCEILALGKPHVLVPLSRLSSRGDQIQNARYFEREGLSVVIAEEALTPETLLMAVNHVFAQRDELTSKMRVLNMGSATLKILEIIQRETSSHKK